jgi:hypothetical protein
MSGPPPLSAPVGPPPLGVEPADWFATLDPLLEVAAGPDQASVWTDPGEPGAAVCPAVRSRCRLALPGMPGADGVTPVETATLVLQTWLTEYVALTGPAASGPAFPAVVELAGVDIATVGPAVAAFLASDPDYARLDPGERAALQADVEAGSGALLVPAGVALGAGAVDPAHAQGYRRVDLRGLDGAGAALAPAGLAAALAAAAGDSLAGHPLVRRLAGPLTPAVVSPEAGYRIRLTGTGLAATTPVTVAGEPAADVWATDDGATAWFTAPAGVEGPAEVRVNGAVAGTLNRVGDAVATAHAAMQSLLVAIEEVRARAAAQLAAGALDALAAAVLRQRMSVAALTAGELQLQRLGALGLAAVPAEVAAAASGYEQQLGAARDAATDELAVSG